MEECDFPDISLHSEDDVNVVRLADEWYDYLDKARVAINVNRKQLARPVKVAILDTGVDVANPEIEKNLKKKIMKWKGFPEVSKPLTDANGHGTYLACVLMRTAPNAWLYIARIFDEKKKCVPAEVARAIEWAAFENEVDIISMSWSMEHNVPVIADVLQRAIAKNVVIIASCPNRSYEPVKFPAICDRVFCIGSATGHGSPAAYNPPNGKKEKYCALGEGVRVPWTVDPNQNLDPSTGQQAGSLYRNGCSTATIVAAGIASLYIDFTRQFCNPGEGADNYENMRKLFREMSKETADRDYRVLVPWSPFRESNPKAYIKQILSQVETPGPAILPKSANAISSPFLFGLEKQAPAVSFVDRTDKPLETLQGRLDVKHLIILSGFAGMGKSELVKHFIWKNITGTPTYKQINWLTASSEPLLLAKLQDLALALKIEVSDGSTSVEIWKSLVDSMVVGERRLIVFDNLGDVSMLKGWAREGFTRSHVIVTTRHSYGFSELRGELLSLNKLSTDQAAEIFRMEYSHQFGGGAPVPSKDQIKELVKRVGNHPSSICHVVAYLRETRTDISDWLGVYKTSPWRFWNSETANIASLASKLSAILLKISEKTDAMRLLCLLSFLQSDQIPVWLLRTNPWLESQHLIEIFRSDWELALKPLSSNSVVSREGSNLSIHKIAQEITKVFLNNPEMDKAGIFKNLDDNEKSTKYWTGRAAELLYGLQGQFVLRKFADQDLIAEHTRSCLDYCQLYGIDSVMNRALLHSFSALVLLNTGGRNRSDLWRDALREYQNIPENVIDLKQGLLSHMMSLRFYILRNYDEASNASLKAMRSVTQLEEQYQEWGLQYQYQLGCIKYAQGRYNDAEADFQRVESKLLEIHGGTEYQRVIPLLEIGRCHLAKERYERALEKFESAADVIKKALKTSANTPDVKESALPLMLIAATHVRQGSFEIGNQHCLHAIGLYDPEFTECHPNALVTLVEHIVVAFQALGEHSQALTWFEKVKSVCDNLYRKENVLCANTLENIAVSICCRGDYEKALQYFDNAEDRYRMFENLDNPPDFRVRLNDRITRHAEILRRTRLTDAISLRKCAIVLLERPPRGQAILKARHQKALAGLYERLGEVQLAIETLSAAVDVFQIALPDDDLEVEQARDELQRLTARPGNPNSVMEDDSDDVDVTIARRRRSTINSTRSEEERERRKSKSTHLQSTQEEGKDQYKNKPEIKHGEEPGKSRGVVSEQGQGRQYGAAEPDQRPNPPREPDASVQPLLIVLLVILLAIFIKLMSS